jgi:periodic tryptophan protein 2
VGDSLYSAVSNTIKKTDLNKNRTSALPLQNPHHNALLVMSPNKTLLVAIDYSGHATLFNLHGNFVVGEFNFKGPVKCAAFSLDGKLLAIGQNQGFFVYECNGVYRTFEPLVLLKKYKSRHSARILTV